MLQSIQRSCQRTIGFAVDRRIPSNPKVIIGQIHSYTGKTSPLVKLQYSKGRLEALVKRSPTGGKDQKLTFVGGDLNTDIAYQIKLQDGVLTITVNGVTAEVVCQ